MVTLLPPGVLPFPVSPGPPVFPGELEELPEPAGDAVVFWPEGVAPPA